MFMRLKSCFRPLSHAVLPAAFLMLAACGATGGGGGGGAVGTVGGKVDAACNEAYGEGCYSFSGSTQREKCTGGKWALIETCAQGTVCQEKITVAGQPGRTTECKPTAVTPGPDTTSGGDGTTLADGTTTGDTGGGSDIKTGDTGGGTDTGGGQIAELLKCAQSSCGDQWASCQQDPACMAVIGCFSSCTADAITCASSCQKSGNDISLSLLQCTQSTCMGSAVCGDGKCTGNEASTCPADCTTGPVCGNSICEMGETPSSCAIDCPVTDLCGNGKCDTGETPLTCIQDCTTAACCTSLGYKCGDVPQCAGTCGVCSGTQTCNASHKCVAGSTCGNGTCDANETNATCPSDCPAAAKVCGDLTCAAGETSAICPIDCPPSGCTDGFCSSSETKTSCPQDCDPATQCMLNNCQSEWVACAGNSACVAVLTCMSKCTAGNTTCTTACVNAASTATKNLLSTYNSCYTNAGCATTATCGDGTCDATETNATCPSDCPATTDPGCVTHTGAVGCLGCSCEATVCAQDSYCCPKTGTGWDSACISECKAAGTICP